MSPYRAPPPIEPWTEPDPFPVVMCSVCNLRLTVRVGRNTRCARCDFDCLMHPKRKLSKTEEFLVCLATVVAFEGALVTFIWAFDAAITVLRR